MENPLRETGSASLKAPAKSDQPGMVEPIPKRSESDTLMGSDVNGDMDIGYGI